MPPPAKDAPERSDAPRALVVAFRTVLILLSLGLVKGAHLLLTGQVGVLLPNLEGWTTALPALGWASLVVAVVALWCWRWWGLRLALGASAFELVVELVGGGLGWHVVRIPVAAALLLGLCLPLRDRFRGS